MNAIAKVNINKTGIPGKEKKNPSEMKIEKTYAVDCNVHFEHASV